MGVCSSTDVLRDEKSEHKHSTLIFQKENENVNNLQNKPQMERSSENKDHTNVKGMVFIKG